MQNPIRMRSGICVKGGGWVRGLVVSEGKGGVFYLLGGNVTWGSSTLMKEGDLMTR